MMFFKLNVISDINFKGKHSAQFRLSPFAAPPPPSLGDISLGIPADTLINGIIPHSQIQFPTEITNFCFLNFNLIVVLSSKWIVTDIFQTFQAAIFESGSRISSNLKSAKHGF